MVGREARIHRPRSSIVLCKTPTKLFLGCVHAHHTFHTMANAGQGCIAAPPDDAAAGRGDVRRQAKMTSQGGNFGFIAGRARSCDFDKNCSNAPPSNELTIAASSCRVNSQPDEEIRLQWSVNTSARTFRECAHLYSNWSSTRASECWAVKDKPRSSIRMEDTDPAQQVVSAQIALATTEPSTYARMIDGVLQNHQHPYTCKFPNFRASTANSCWFSTLRTWSHNARASTVSCSRLSHARSFTTPCNEPSPGI